MKKFFIVVFIGLIAWLFFFKIIPGDKDSSKNVISIKNRPLTIYASDELTSEEISQLKEAIDEWNKFKPKNFFVYGGIIPSESISNYYERDGISAVSKYPLNTSATGNTDTFDRNGDIIEANIVFNSNFEYNYDGKKDGRYYLKSLLMHELGHALGLVDSYDCKESIMYYKYTGLTKISDYDLNNLKALY